VASPGGGTTGGHMNAGTQSRSDALGARAPFTALLATLALAVVAAPAARAALPADLGSDKPTVATLPSPPSSHWVWVNDFVFPHMSDGLAYLVDGDSGRYLGTLSTGFGFARVVLPRDGKLIYAPETYFSRGTRGIRTDVVTIYDAVTLKVQGEIQVPPKRASNIPNIGNAELTDDDRFLLIYNFNPAQSVSVVDMANRAFVGEIETPGCALAFPTGPRSFFSMCADGGLLAVQLDDSGKVATQSRTEPLFDVAHDPVTEKPVRGGDTWYFVSFAGRVHTVRSGKNGLEAGDSWWLSTKAERAQGWRPGGVQQLAFHAGQKRLYAIMHQGPLETHKDPGKSVWVADVVTHRRVKEIKTRRLSSSIQLSKDDHPLLFSIFIDSNVLDVYDPASGKLLRSVANVGTSPTLLLTP
jgi:methylamine dehydrogenase heavy chain